MTRNLKIHLTSEYSSGCLPVSVSPTAITVPDSFSITTGILPIMSLNPPVPWHSSPFMPMLDEINSKCPANVLPSCAFCAIA
ncbi:MAG: hypothetical protein ACKPJ9_00675 [Dolichospermum sp.]